MTWLCPDWDVKQILNAAKKYGYDGVEIRVESNQKHGIELTASKEERLAAKRAFADAGIKISCIATSLQFAIPDESKQKDNIETIKKYIELCVDTECPYIRVFGGQTAPGEIKGVISFTAAALIKAADCAKGTDVKILLETHDNFSQSVRVAEVLKTAKHPNLGALWDVMHPFRLLDSFSYAYSNLKGYVQHLHIHDGIYLENGAKMDICFLGEGVIDHRIPMKFMKEEGFGGHFSVEIIGKGEPDRWLEQYAKKFREYEKEI